MASSSSSPLHCNDDSERPFGCDADSPLFDQSSFFHGQPTPVYLNPDKRKSPFQPKRAKAKVIFCQFCQRVVKALYLEYFCTWECALSHYRSTDLDFHYFICNEITKVFPPGYLPKPIPLDPKQKSVEEFWDEVLSTLYPEGDPRNFDLRNRFASNSCRGPKEKGSQNLKKIK